MNLLASCVLVLVAVVFAADPPEVATGVPAEPSYTRFSLEEDLAKEMSTIAPADSESHAPSISISELHANNNMMETTPAAEPEPTTKQTFIMKITTKSPMLQALMNETMEHEGMKPTMEHEGMKPVMEHEGMKPTMEHEGMKPTMEHEGMKPVMEEMVPKPASVKPVDGAVHETKPMETMKSTEKPMMENTPKPEPHDDDEHYQNDSPLQEPQPEPEPEPVEDKNTTKPVTQKPITQTTPSSKDKATSASSQLVSNTTKSHNAASSLSPSLVLATIVLSRLVCC